MFNVQKKPVLVSDDVSLAQKPHLDTRTESCKGGRKLPGVCLPFLITLGRRGAVGDSVPDVLQSTSPSPSSSSVMQVDILPKI